MPQDELGMARDRVVPPVRKGRSERPGWKACIGYSAGSHGNEAQPRQLPDHLIPEVGSIDIASRTTFAE